MRTSFGGDWFPLRDVGHIQCFPPRTSIKCTIKAKPECDSLDMHRAAVQHWLEHSAFSFLDYGKKPEITFIFPHGHEFPDVHW